MMTISTMGLARSAEAPSLRSLTQVLTSAEVSEWVHRMVDHTG